MSRVKAWAGYAVLAAVPFFALSAAYGMGYERGYHRGSIVMRDAIMCVLERTADIHPYTYCVEQKGLRS